jgi:radical SAM protein with 4Fe4S-binding SPASM domain
LPLPLELQVEVTAACNLRCRMCLVGHREPIGRLEGSLDIDRFARLLDALPGLQTVTLQGLGEPLLAPRLADLVAMAKGRGIAVGFNTNGTLLDARHRRLLIDLGVDWVHVSVDAANPAVFEAIRPGASFERIVANLRALVRERGVQGPPRVQLNAVLMRRTLPELVPLVRLAADVGVDRLWAQQLSHDLRDVAGRPDFASLRAFTAAESLWSDAADADPHTAVDGRPDAAVVVAEARALAGELGLDVRLPRVADVAGRAGEADRETADRLSGPSPDASGQDAGAGPSTTEGQALDELPCDWPWRSAYVRHDGKVQPCCMLMGGDRAILGDVQAGGFAAVWGGSDYEAFRDGLATGAPPSVCRGCSMYRGVF